MRRIFITLCCTVVVCSLCTSLVAEPWSQWGGPQRDFIATATSEIEAWGELGPRLLWLRELGPGYAGLVSDGQRLFTMTRRGSEELVVALDADDGSTLWEHTYGAPTDKLQWVDKSYGDAPQATPLLVDGQLISLGFTGVVTSLRAVDGKPLWSHDLGKEYGVRMPYFGHASSPVQVGETVVVVAGGAHAFDLKTGEVRWQNRDFDGSYASPIVVQSPAGEQLVIAGAGEVVGVDPQTGNLHWRHEHANQHKTFLNTPLANDDGLVFASAYFLGSIALRLEADGSVRRLWQVEDLQVSQSNAVRFDNMVVASHNRNLVAVDLATGETLWREKGVGRSNLIRFGEKTLLFDDKGRLTLATLNRQGLQRETSAEILEGRCWTAPAMVGSRLYVRNQSHVAAVDLAASARRPEETLVGLLGGEVDRSKIVAPPDFLRAASQLQAAALAGTRKILENADTTFAAWTDDPRLGIYAHYYRGFAAWRMSYLDDRERQVEWVDRAVEALKASLELDNDFVESHALLSTLYSAYYRLDPQRASVVGPLGGDHLSAALEEGADNPRVMAFQAMKWVHSPPQFGGDLVKGLEGLRLAVDRSDQERRPENHPGPTWGAGLVRSWYAGQLLQGNAEQRQLGENVLQEAVQRFPEFVQARRELEALSSESSGDGI